MRFFRRLFPVVSLLPLIPLFVWTAIELSSGGFWTIYATARPFVLGMGIFLGLLYVFVRACEHEVDGF